jgi:hypothetical protein
MPQVEILLVAPPPMELLDVLLLVMVSRTLISRSELFHD